MSLQSDIEADEDLDPFAVPEYFVTHTGRHEVVEGSECVRIYYGTQRNRVFRPEFSVVMPISRAPTLAREAVAAASDAHNQMTFDFVAGGGFRN